MTKRLIYPKNFILETLIEKIGRIVHVDAYLSFVLISSGIEFLGKCVDVNSKWGDEGLSKKQFKNAIEELFPESYHSLMDDLYSDLRCGLVHRITPGSISLTQNGNDQNGEIQYISHPYIKKGRKILVVEYFYFDFVEACKKVLAKDFDEKDKMNEAILYVG